MLYYVLIVGIYRLIGGKLDVLSMNNKSINVFFSL